MAAFRCFMMYDYQKEFFFLFITRGFSTTPQWADTKFQLEKKLKENKSNPSNLDLNTEFGVFKCKNDCKAKCYFILLSRHEVQEEFQNLALQKIFDRLRKEPNYFEFDKIEIEKKYSSVIDEMLKECEQYQQESTLARQKQQQSQKIVQIRRKQNPIQQNDFCSLEVLLLIYRGFMMYDQNRQFFFMFVRKGFPLDKSWTLERNSLEKEILQKFNNDQAPQNFVYKGTFGVYRALLDEQAKCYFILLSRFGSPQLYQKQLLGTIYELVLKIENYISVFKDDIKIKYDILESQIKNEIEYLIDEQEYSTQMVVDPKFIDPKVFKEKLMRQPCDKQVTMFNYQITQKYSDEITQRGPLLYETDSDLQITEPGDRSEKKLLYNSKGDKEQRKK